VFGLDGGLVEKLYDEFDLILSPGEIVAVIGPSGSGKSVLLRQVMRRVPGSVWLEHQSLSECDWPAISALVDTDDTGRPRNEPVSLGRRMALLARCGLAEPAALITPAKRLSAGQLHRLALAKALWCAEADVAERLPVIVADEFAASLDWPTGRALARQVHRLIKSRRASLIVATHRWDILDDLRPDRILVKPLGEPPRIIRRRRWLSASAARARPPRWRIRRGSIADYHALGRFHYLTGPPAAHKRVYVVPAPRADWAFGGPTVAAVAVVSPPVLQCRARNLVTGGRYCRSPRRLAVRRLNREVETVSRVIVHPMYRGQGLAVRLVRHILATTPMAMVEALAVMGRYHPFFERAGMTARADPTCRYVYYHYRSGRSDP
jgi:ABC-type ATPase with predicted acetyltransferase domain